MRGRKLAAEGETASRVNLIGDVKSTPLLMLQFLLSPLGLEGSEGVSLIGDLLAGEGPRLADNCGEAGTNM